MGTFTGTLKAFSSRWYCRQPLRPSRQAESVPIEVVGDSGSGIMGGVVYINKASLVGCGGTGITITDTTSTITLTE